VNSARHEVGKVAKDLQVANKTLNQLEIQLEQERASRHSILIQCKMDNINIPMSRGNLEEIDEEGAEDPSIEVSASQVN